MMRWGLFVHGELCFALLSLCRTRCFGESNDVAGLSEDQSLEHVLTTQVPLRTVYSYTSNAARFKEAQLITVFDKLEAGRGAETY